MRVRSLTRVPRRDGPWLGHLTLASALALTAVLLVPDQARAEEPINSTTELKQACDGSDHHVVATVDINLNTGPHQDVASGCKITLGPLASFEADGVSMSFAGPFEIYSARERSVTFTGSVWKARSLGFFGGDVSSFKNVASHLRASTGAIRIITGPQSSVQIQSQPAASPYALDAGGTVFITGSEKLFIGLADTGIRGAKGVRIEFGGQDSVLKAEDSQVRSSRGPINIASGAAKPLVELKAVTLTSVGGSATVNLAASESKLTAGFTEVSSKGGSVILRAGTQGRAGAVELFETSLQATQEVRVESSLGHEKGVVKIDRSTLSGGADIVLATGPLGATEVKGSSISSGTAIRILTGTGGTCTAGSNDYQAPVQQICP